MAAKAAKMSDTLLSKLDTGCGIKKGPGELSAFSGQLSAFSFQFSVFSKITPSPFVGRAQ
jgi:hypothetical protein